MVNMARDTEATVEQKHSTHAIISSEYSSRNNEYRCIEVSSSTRGKGKVLVPRKSDAPTSVKIAALSNMYVFSCSYG